MRDSTVAIVPIRSLREGKSRLTAALTDSDRSALTQTMLDAVLRAVLSADEVLRVIVISPDAETLDFVAQFDDRVIPLEQDGQNSGLNAAIDQAYREAARIGAASTMVVFGDLPFLTGDEIRNVLRRDAPVVIGPDREGDGTNLLLIRPGSPDGPASNFQFAYGPGSYYRHVQQAHLLSLDVATVQMPGIAFDLDTPEDLEELRLSWPGLNPPAAMATTMGGKPNAGE